MRTHKNRRAALFSSLALLVGVAACRSSDPIDPADLVLRGGTVVTVDDALPRAEAIAIRGFEIVAVGSDREIDAYVGPETNRVELQGRLAIPGFIDGHAHYLSLGEAKMILDLMRAATWSEIVEQVTAAVRQAEPGEWILGSGWHQEKWTDLPDPNLDGLPLHARLSSISPENPVYLAHASGHAAFVNEMAMTLAGIASATPDPPGGTIVRDADGHPTGLMRETAEGLIRAVIEREDSERAPQEREAEFRRQMELAGKEALSKGITTIHDAGASFDDIDRFKVWANEGALPVRLYVMVSLEETNEILAERLADYRIIPEG
ncbi:MAG: amidohydrolase family protein, partial [Deltaproteobacteria bacterium]|nr:amidohydrolase family protein [Deltaproteobacteria bacterium]